MLFDNEFPPDPRVENEIQSLIASSNEIHLLCYNFGKKPKYEIFNGIHIHRFRIKKQVAKKILGLIIILPLYKITWQYQLKRILKKIKIEAIHLHDLPLCVLAGFMKNNFNIPIIADMHENYPFLVTEQPYMNSLPGRIFLSKSKWFEREKDWLDMTDHIICVADEMKERLVADVVHKKKDIIVVPNTLNIELFVKSQQQDPGISARFRNFFNIVYIGGLDPLRGIDLLLEALILLKDELDDMRLILVGTGSSREELQHFSKRSELGNKVYFEGLQPSSLIGTYIEASQICVIPHLRTVQTDNSSPNKLFQYMYHKKPVISSNCKSLEKIITETGCGLIFMDRNSKDLSDKIKFLYQNRDKGKVMGEKGFNAVIDKFNWQITSKPLQDLYSNLECRTN